MSISAPHSVMLRAGMRRLAVRVVAASLGLLLSAGTLRAQEQPAPPPEGTVQFNLQGEVKLDALVNYISQRLGVRFVYGTDIANRRVTIHTPVEVPVASLMTLLGSVLRAENLAIVDSDVPGWKRIVDAGEMALHAPTGQAEDVLEKDGPAAPVTQVFTLKQLQAQPLTQVLRPFLTKTFGTIFSLPESNVIVVTDYSINVKMIAELVTLIDRPPGETTYEFYEVQHQQSSELTEQVQSILGAPEDGGEGEARREAAVRLFDEPSGNRIIVAGKKSLVQRAMDLLKQLDVSLGMTSKLYRLRNVPAERVDTLIRGYLTPQEAEQAFQSTVDEDGNMLVVRATAEIHERLAGLIEELDQPVDAADSPIRFYKLKNAQAIDALYSLLALQDVYGTGGAFGAGSPFGAFAPFGGMPAYPGMAPVMPGTPGMANPLLRGGPAGGAGPGAMPARPGQTPGRAQPTTTRLPLRPGEDGADGGRPDSLVEEGSPLSGPMSGPLGMSMGMPMGGLGGVATLPGGARVSADVSTNSIIVAAPASSQAMYARLIESLDQRRPQVLIEAQIVAIDTSDNYSLGVEVSIGDRTGPERLFKFTSFGLSEVDPVSGALEIIPSLGFNGTLVDPDVADVVIKALASHSRARVLAAPKILVNDNSTGKLESITSIPFQSVNASETVSTTSLGGDQQAGTIITVTPHINEDDHLQLEFDVEFSTFQGSGSATLPPPRQIDRVGSTVTIPDGQTVIVGGLKRTGESHQFTGIPWLENVPIVRELSSLTNDEHTTTSFFLFIRPKVLRDSCFQDLKFYSSKSAHRAGIPGEYPRSGPLLIR